MPVSQYLPGSTATSPAVSKTQSLFLTDTLAASSVSLMVGRFCLAQFSGTPQ